MNSKTEGDEPIARIGGWVTVTLFFCKFVPCIIVRRAYDIHMLSFWGS